MVLSSVVFIRETQIASLVGRMLLPICAGNSSVEGGTIIWAGWLRRQGKGFFTRASKQQKIRFLRGDVTTMSQFISLPSDQAYHVKRWPSPPHTLNVSPQPGKSIAVKSDEPKCLGCGFCSNGVANRTAVSVELAPRLPDPPPPPPQSTRSITSQPNM